MSYARWGDDSDVYVINGDTCFCGPKPFHSKTLRGLRRHLEAHVRRGDKVPARAFARIDRELTRAHDSEDGAHNE